MILYSTYLGGNELVVSCKGGACVVTESYRNYEIVFTGSYTECVDYCEDRWIDYEESIVG